MATIYQKQNDQLKEVANTAGVDYTLLEELLRNDFISKAGAQDYISDLLKDNFVTTNTAQTISGAKSFTSRLNYLNSRQFSKGTVPGAYLGDSTICFDDKDGNGQNNRLAFIQCGVQPGGAQSLRLAVYKNEANTASCQNIDICHALDGSFYIKGPSYLDDHTINNGYFLTSAMLRQLSGNIAANSATADLATQATCDALGNIISDTYMDLSSPQTITGAKTFTSAITQNGDHIWNHITTNMEKGNPSGKANFCWFMNGNNSIDIKDRLAGIVFAYDTSGTTRASLIAHKDSPGTVVDACIHIFYPREGGPYATCPTITTLTDNSDTIVTTKFLRNVLTKLGMDLTQLAA